MPAVKDPLAPTGTSSPDAHETFHLDALIVGAGFSGVAMLHRVRQLGLSAKIFEAGTDLGGTWYWNRYPGARVDSEWPMYQLSIPATTADRPFRYSQRYSDHKEVRAYFAHLDATIHIKRDTLFGARVVACSWDPAAARWTVRSAAGHVAVARYLILASGVFAEGHTPAFPGLPSFKGDVYHTSQWPHDEPSFAGKRVGLVGLGATGVQVAQEVAKTAERLTIFVRRPSYCLPAGQAAVSDADHARWMPELPEMLAKGRRSLAGFPLVTPWKDDRELAPRPSFHEHTPAQREAFWEELWGRGGFVFMRDNYSDAITDEAANRGAYEFWARKIRERMAKAGADEHKRAILAPAKPPYHIFTKRVPLEVDFYDLVGRPNVELVDLTAEAFDAFNETGVRLKGPEGERQMDLDVMIMATGFDAFAGAVRKMGLKDREGVEIMKGHWRDGFRTYLGTMMHGFPNLFMSFTPHAPTAFSNAPTCIEAQCDLACSIIQSIESSAAHGEAGKRIKTIEPTAAAEDVWAANVDKQTQATLLPNTISWWNRNGPDGKFQSLNYIKGIETFENECRSRVASWEGFDIKYWDDGKVGRMSM